jgi:hypothetical protein
MIQSRLVEEGLSAVTAIRDRYDGEKRNPWNEFECGSNYARSMASYSLLNAFSGLRFDMTRRMIGFDPIQLQDGRFRCFWSLRSAWGEVEMAPGRAELCVLYGALPVRLLDLPRMAKSRVETVAIGGTPLEFAQEGGEIHFESEVCVQAGQSLALIMPAARSGGDDDDS